MLSKVPKRKVRKKQELLFDKRKGPALENMVLDAKGQAEEPMSGMKTRRILLLFLSTLKNLAQS